MKQNKNLDWIKNPASLGVAFFVVYLISGLIIPNNFAGASFVEVLIPIILLVYFYIKHFGSNLEKPQVRGIAFVFFVAGSILSIVATQGLAEQQGRSLSMTDMLIVIIFVGFMAVLLYFFVLSIANIVFTHLEFKKHVVAQAKKEHGKRNNKRKA